MDARFKTPTLQRGPRRGLTWGLAVAVILLAVSLAGCGKEKVTVPDLVGMKTDAAEQVLEAVDLELGDIERLTSDTTTVEADTVLS